MTTAPQFTAAKAAQPAWPRRSIRAALLVAGFALAACDGLPPGTIPTVSAPATVAPLPPESVALAAYYQRLQQELLTQGLLRTDGGGPDTPFSDLRLAQNFVRIALFDEYTVSAGTLRPQTTISRLRRWENPIRMQIEFGADIPADQQVRDRNATIAYANRLSRLTGVPISQATRNPNYHVLFFNEADRRGFAARLRAIAPGIAESSVRAFVDLPRDQLCIVIGTFRPDGVTYDKAIALIRGEHPDLLRLSCIHEELAQGMGLANDSPRARPSIFNDDEEFGFLTNHDELLLKMLYDPRLTTGMSAAEAAPIARQIAAEIMAGPV